MNEYDTNPVVEYVPDVSKFPDPQRYATYMRGREPAFKTHTHLGHVKNAISGKLNQGMLLHDVYVYEFNFDSGTWEAITRIPRQTDVRSHPWYSQKQASKKTSIIGPSDKAVDAAIASILGAVND